ncbi:substrate-binding domain-containing protein [Paraburkholderia sp. B3]|uniref:substrate-binding domain-containing protein n=1 Tax=Paraburkholderia sp. B3 TaxID=3134791 RepID=UPI003981F7B0
MPQPTRRRLMIASALAAVAAACPAARGDERTYKIGLVLKGLDDPYTTAMITAANVFQAHSPYPFTLVVRGTAGQTDVDRQIALVGALAKAAVNAIVLAPTDSRALVPAASQCIRRGILVVTIDNPLDTDAQRTAGVIVPFIGPDNRRGARLAGNYLARLLHPGDEVAIIGGVSTDGNALQRNAGFRDAMQSASARIVAVEPGDWEYGAGRLAAAAILAKYPRLRALLCGNDNMARGAVDAIRAAHLKGRVLVVGYNDSAAIKPMLADGRVLATVNQFEEKQAVYGIDVVLQALEEQHTQADLPEFFETPTALVTRNGK